MNRTQWMAIAALVVLGGLVLLLFLRNRQAPIIPPDVDHIWSNAEACAECHGPDGGMPQSRNHPVGQDCMRCHGTQR